jgi:hypothetical protein
VQVARAARHLAGARQALVEEQLLAELDLVGRQGVGARGERDFVDLEAERRRQRVLVGPLRAEDRSGRDREDSRAEGHGEDGTDHWLPRMWSGHGSG